MNSPPAPDGPVPDPTVCPFCGSTKIAAPLKKVDTSTYWRCEACNEMWNVGRHKAAGAGSYRGHWNRGRWDGGRY